jgi:hypothetical protein
VGAVFAVTWAARVWVVCAAWATCGAVAVVSATLTGRKTTAAPATRVLKRRRRMKGLNMGDQLQC